MLQLLLKADVALEQFSTYHHLWHLWHLGRRLEHPGIQIATYVGADLLQLQFAEWHGYLSHNPTTSPIHPATTTCGPSRFNRGLGA